MIERVMTEAQRDRLVVLLGTGDCDVRTIPDGSWLIQVHKAGRTWIEVIDPEASARLAFDFDR